MTAVHASDVAVTAAASRARPRPPAPEPLERPLGVVATLRRMRASPIELFTRQHFELPFLQSTSSLGTMVIVSEPAAIRHVLVDNALNYRKDVHQQNILAPALGNGLLAVEDEQWRNQRRLFGPLFTPRTVAEFAKAMGDAGHDLVQKWKRHDGEPLDVAAEMRRVAIDVLQRTIFIDGFGRDPDDLAHAVWRYIDALGRVDPLNVLNAPQWVPRIGHFRARQSLTFFSQLIESMIAVRRRAMASSRAAPNDLLTILLKAGDRSTGSKLSQAEIEGNISTFFATGFESAANALTWSLFLVSQDREWRERMEAEVDRELPAGRFVEGSLDRLIVTRAVIEEAMRLYPPVPTISRQSIGPDRLAGQSIGAGTIVMIAPWVVHRHRTLWTEPELYDPSRFLPGARENIDRYAFLPFGAGPQTCIGMYFAMQEIVIVLATIVRAFRLEVATGHRVWPVHCVSLRPRGGLPMTLHRRRSASAAPRPISAVPA